MLEVYQSKGFKILSQQLNHMKTEGTDLNQGLDSMLSKLNKQENSTTEVKLVYDRSKKDVGLLIRLYAL
jgi:hypothetical protein